MNKIEQHTKKRRKENKNRPKLLRYPELVVFAGRTLFYEGAEIGGDVAVVWKLFQDVDLQFDFLFLVLEKKDGAQQNREHGIGSKQFPTICYSYFTSVTSMTLMAASWPVLVWRPYIIDKQSHRWNPEVTTTCPFQHRNRQADTLPRYSSISKIIITHKRGLGVQVCSSCSSILV